MVKEPFVVINADDYYGKDAFKVAADFLKNLDSESKGKYANIVYEVSNTMTENGSVKRAVCLEKDGLCNEMIESTISRNDNNEIVAIPLENPDKKMLLDENQSVSMNMFAFTKDILDDLVRLFPAFLNRNKENILTCEYLIPSVVTDLFKEKKATLELLPTKSVWYGVTYRDDKEHVVKSLKNLVDSGKYIKGLWVK